MYLLIKLAYAAQSMTGLLILIKNLRNETCDEQLAH